jgi:hypothetical protein
VIDADRLLGDLQGDLSALVADLSAQVAGDGEVRGRLEGEWRRAFPANRKGRSFEDWSDDRLTRVGGVLLACVFVRFCEDNGLIDEAAIAGPRDGGAAARAAQQRYFTEHPHHSDREYLQRCSMPSWPAAERRTSASRDDSPRGPRPHWAPRPAESPVWWRWRTWPARC